MDLASLASRGPPLPLSAETIMKTAAALKQADFRSAASLLSALKLAHIDEKHDFPLWMARLFTKCIDSCNRGLGPATKAPELPLDDIHWPAAGHEFPQDVPEEADGSYVVAEK